MRVMILAVVILCGCESVSSVADEWLTRDPETESSQAEQVVETTGWLLPTPWRELAAALVGGAAGFWTHKRRADKKN